MAGDVDAYEVALFVEPLHGAPFCIDLRRLWFRDFDFGDVVKQGGGGVGFVGLIVLAVGNEFVEEEITVFAGGEELFATDGTEPVKGTSEGQTFNAFLIAGKEIDSLDEVVDRLVGAVFLSFGEDGINGCFSDSFDGTKAEADFAEGIDAEFDAALIDVRAEGADAHRLALVHQFGDGFDVGKAATHDAGHILGWIVGFQIGRLVGHPGITRCMALVEGIGGEGTPVFPDFFKHLGVVAVCRATFDELGIHVV